MKRFAIQAVCDEKALWDIMNFLEQMQCASILTRPVPDVSTPLRRLDNMTQLDAALHIIRKQESAITPNELRVAMHAAGYKVGKTHGIVFILKKRGQIRMTTKGHYVAK